MMASIFKQFPLCQMELLWAHFTDMGWLYTKPGGAITSIIKCEVTLLIRT